MSRNKMLPSGRKGRMFFHWAKLHPSELHCILLSYAAAHRSFAKPSDE
jgi:hypothetical protein